MNPHPPSPDNRIDHVLNALRDTQPSPDLNARIAAHIAKATESRTATTPFFAVISNAVKNAVKHPSTLFAGAPLYTLAATSLAILAILSLIVLHSHHPTTTPSQISAIVLHSQSSAHSLATNIAQNSNASAARKPYTSAAQNPDASAAPKPYTSAWFEGAGLQSRRNPPNIHEPLASVPSNIQVPQGFSLGSHRASQRAGVLTPSPSQQPTDPDPDAIALAETLAPSHSAPPMPLTQQELLALAILRSGNKEEIAALNPVHREALFAQEQAAFHDFFPTPTPATTTGDKE